MFSLEALPASVYQGGVYMAAAGMLSKCGHLNMLYMHSASPEQQACFCHRDLDTDTVELVFSLVNSSLHCRATAKMVVQHLLRLDIQETIKQMPNKKFTAPYSRRHMYSLHDLQASQSFNNPETLDRNARVTKARKIAHGKVAKKFTIRGIYNPP